MKQDLFLWLIMAVYSNVIFYNLLSFQNEVKTFKQYLKYADNVIIIYNATYLVILGGYWILKYCGN